MSPTLMPALIAALWASGLAIGPALAGSEDDAAQRIEGLLNFAGNTVTGVQTMEIDVDGCALRLEFSSIEDGRPIEGWMTGELEGIRADSIFLRPNATGQEVRFEFGSDVAGWAVGSFAAPGDPFYEALTNNGPEVAHLQRTCDDAGCTFQFDLTGGTGNNHAEIDLTGVVSPDDAPILVNAFRNLATLCTEGGSQG